MRPVLPALVLALLLGTACQGTRASTAPRPPAPDTAPPMAYYEAGGPIPEPTRYEDVHIDDLVEVRKIFLPPRLPAGLEDFPNAKEEIEIVHFRPRPRGGTPRPLVLMSPILGNDMTLMPEFARGFTRLGYHAAVVKRKEFAFDPETALDDAEKEFRLLVMRAKQALDWLASLDEVDGTRVATFGVSAGAIISACLAGADRRPKAHVLVLAGGPTADVLMDTDEGRFEDYGKEVLATGAITKEEIRAQLRETLRTDPIRLAPRVRREDVLMFIAKKDTSVPTKHGITLWNAYGRPEIRWLPWGHYTAFLQFWWMQHEANMFIRHKLGPP